ncbi:MATE family efflux transporter [Streptomyces diastatochromogenes]|uniref:MATE family efflux transporter n=1 Tax=Streptomyces diastatochromogenes TaxID=42236 RepID=UPI002F25F4C6
MTSTTATPLSTGARRKLVLALALPVIAENLLEALMQVVDSYLVSGLGDEALAGVGGALQVLFFLLAVLGSLSIGVSVLVSQVFGAGDLPGVARLARQALLLTAVLSVPVAILGYLLAGPVIGLFGMDAGVARIATEYLKVTMATIVVLVGLYTAGGVLRGIGDTRSPMLITALANVLNVVLAYALIHGSFGLPALGAVGSAWGTFIARAIALALMLALLVKGRNGVSIGGRGWRLGGDTSARIWKISAPAVIEQVLTSGAFLFLAAVIAHLGTASLAAHRVVQNSMSIFFLTGIGFSTAAMVLVGQSVGAQRIHDGVAALRIATRWAVGALVVQAVVVLVFAPQIMGLFADDPTVTGPGADALRMLALAQPFWAVLFVQSAGVRGTGNTRWPLVVTGTGMVVMVLLSYLAMRAGGGLGLTWSTGLVVVPVVGALHWWRFRRTVADHPAPPAGATGPHPDTQEVSP